MSIGGKVIDCIATSFPACRLGCSSASACENFGGDIVTCHPTGADEIIGVILVVGTDAVLRPTAGMGVKSLESAGKKLRQSS